tara:strand:- start:113 stop:613 length:501 start_codon:yes stop_codon:yes gene_type:complete
MVLNIDIKRLLLPLLAALALPTAANSSVESEVHKKCLKAMDYMGCVKAHSVGVSNKRMTIDQGINLSEGNACASGYAYIGGGTCRKVSCLESAFRKNQPELKAAGWSCGKRFWRYVLIWGESTLRAHYDPSCPPREPAIGQRNTCQVLTEKTTPEEESITQPMDLE